MLDFAGTRCGKLLCETVEGARQHGMLEEMHLFICSQLRAHWIYPYTMLCGVCANAIIFMTRPMYFLQAPTHPMARKPEALYNFVADNKIALW